MNKKNVNAILELEKLKGRKINNVSQYNHAVQCQIIQKQQQCEILKHYNTNQIKNLKLEKYNNDISGNKNIINNKKCICE